MLEKHTFLLNILHTVNTMVERKKYTKAKFDYNGDSAYGDLNFKMGERIEVIYYSNSEGWWYGKNTKGE